jgi:hypothetical protein
LYAPCYVVNTRLRFGLRKRRLSMDLILATTAQCGDYRLRWQGSIDDSAQCDRLHAGSDHWGIRCATREAEKGKACKAVSNAVPWTRRIVWEHRTWQRGIRGRRIEYMPDQIGRPVHGGPAIQSPPRGRQKVVHEFGTTVGAAGVCWSWPIAARECRSKRPAARLPCSALLTVESCAPTLLRVRLWGTYLGHWACRRCSNTVQTSCVRQKHVQLHVPSAHKLVAAQDACSCKATLAYRV